MTRIRVLIVDDEPLARAGLRALLQEDREIEIVGECANGREALSFATNTMPDIMFLDIRMPHMDGLATLAKMDQPPVTIFVTAHDEHALTAFELTAFDYILKPVDEARFLAALARAKAQVRLLRASTQPPQYLTRLAVPDGPRTRIFDVNDVDWIEAENYYARVHVDKASYLLRESLSSLANRLDPQLFFRVHRTAIVNLSRVTEIKVTSRGSFAVSLTSGGALKLSRERRGKLQQLLEQRL